MPAREILEKLFAESSNTCCEKVRGGTLCTRTAAIRRNGQPYCQFHDPERSHLSIPAARDKRRKAGWQA